MDEGDLAFKDQLGGNHGTFRPVSILDRGLDLNEDDMLYDDNVRATLHEPM